MRAARATSGALPRLLPEAGRRLVFRQQQAPICRDCSGFGIAFGDGNSLIGTSGFLPSYDDLLTIGQAPFSFFASIPAATGYFFEVVFET